MSTVFIGSTWHGKGFLFGKRSTAPHLSATKAGYETSRGRGPVTHLHAFVSSFQVEEPDEVSGEVACQEAGICIPQDDEGY